MRLGNAERDTRGFDEKIEWYADGGGDRDPTRATIRSVRTVSGRPSNECHRVNRWPLRMRRMTVLEFQSQPRTRKWNLWGPGAFRPSERTGEIAALPHFLADTLPQ